jgi:hypothetical protein
LLFIGYGLLRAVAIEQKLCHNYNFPTAKKSPGLRKFGSKLFFLYMISIRTAPEEEKTLKKKIADG